MATKKRRASNFWNDKRRAALKELKERYDLKLIELMYLRTAILEEAATTELNNAVVAQLDALAEDVRDFFLRNCPTDPDDPSHAQFFAALEDRGAQRRHREVWDQIRDSLVSRALDYAPAMPRAQA